MFSGLILAISVSVKNKMTAWLKGGSLFFKSRRNYKMRIATADFGIADPFQWRMSRPQWEVKDASR
jgi:hypothetical protein